MDGAIVSLPCGHTPDIGEELGLHGSSTDAVLIQSVADALASRNESSINYDTSIVFPAVVDILLLISSCLFSERLR